MHRILIAAALVTATMGAADAAGRHKHPRATYAPPTYAHVVPPAQIGPIWAGPNQCWTDEGYGRYAPCNGRR